MPFTAITKSYKDQLITKVVIKQDHITFYFGDYSKHPNGTPLKHFTKTLGTYAVSESKSGVSYAYFAPERINLPANEVPKDLPQKDLLIMNKHSAATVSQYHEASLFGACCFDEKNIQHIHVKAQNGKLSADQVVRILTMADRYQQRNSFVPLIKKYSDQVSDVKSALIPKESSGCSLQ